MIQRGSLSLGRFWAIVVKEFVQMRRDRLTFGMMIGIPILQLTLFGFAINSDPKHLPTAVVLADYGPQGRTLLGAIKNVSPRPASSWISAQKSRRAFGSTPAVGSSSNNNFG